MSLNSEIKTYEWKVIRLGSVYILTNRDKNYFDSRKDVQDIINKLTLEMNTIDVALEKTIDNSTFNSYDKSNDNINQNLSKMKTFIGKLGYTKMADEMFVSENVEESYGSQLFQWLQENFIDKEVNPKDLKNVFTNSYNKLSSKTTKVEKTFVIYADENTNTLLPYVYIYGLDQNINIERHANMCMESSSKHINQTLILQKFLYSDPKDALGQIRERIESLYVRDKLVDYLIGKQTLDDIIKEFNKDNEKPKTEN